MKKIILPFVAMTMVAGCSGITPHGKWSPYSVFHRGAALELQEASRQASLAKSPQQALSYYEAVYNKNRDDEAVATAYAQALRLAGFPDRGVVVLEDHYMNKKVSSDTVLEYIKDHMAMGQFDEAETLIKSRISLVSQEQRTQMIQAYLAAVRHARVQKIIEPERPNFENTQGDPQLHNLLGVVYDARGEPEKAEVEFRNALHRWSGEKSAVENNLALCLANQGKLEEAMSVISKAFVAAPDRPEVARNLEIISTLYKGKKTQH